MKWMDELEAVLEVTFQAPSHEELPWRKRPINFVRSGEQRKGKKALSPSSSCGGATRTICHIAQCHVTVGRRPDFHRM